MLHIYRSSDAFIANVVRERRTETNTEASVRVPATQTAMSRGHKCQAETAPSFPLSHLTKPQVFIKSKRSNHRHRGTAHVPWLADTARNKARVESVKLIK